MMSANQMKISHDKKAEVQRSIPVYIRMEKKLEVYLLKRERCLIKGVNSLKNLGKGFDLLLKMNLV